jgi:hypothetical protein
MAALSSSVGAAVDRTLDEIGAALSDFASILEDQRNGDLSEHERITLSLEWDREMHHLGVILARAYRSGQMAPEQQKRYRELIEKLREALPTVNALGFPRPDIALDT